ncbi:MAG: 50S ribosome-binding GTPase [Candidatus Aureabacteria bacterium]|nr:50S ribosome-binding GTPase [Candidatus Auribacterota bacterium]
MSVLVERDHIGIFGRMNVGKSSVMNLLTQQETSIIDPTPGTTSDTKYALSEIHCVGPVKIYDTAGVDEPSLLGDKKRKKVFNDIKECDLALIMINPAFIEFKSEEGLIKKARELDKQILIIYNIFNDDDGKKIRECEQKNPVLRFCKKITLKANDERYRKELIDFIIANFKSKNQKHELFPFLEKDEYYVLIIPMDAETPPGRYLRPQAMSEEYITRNWAYPVSFRLDLGKARSEIKEERESEEKRFNSFLNDFKKRPKAMITDSQAMDIMNRWCPGDIMLTTFSITMINYISRGKLKEFIEGMNTLKNLKSGDRVLVVEACNHSRIGEDIGTVQIPNYFKKHFKGIALEHNFGREFQENENLKRYKLIIHCGGCMISSQKLLARIHELEAVGIPFTNYGLFLAYLQGREALNKVIKPWNLC